MVDNTELNTGSGGDTIGTDDIGGVKYQRVKIIHGADGTNDGDVASANPLPIAGPVSLTGSGSVVVSGGLVSLTGSSSVVISNTVNTEVVGDVSLTGSMSVVISSGTVEIGGDVSLTGSMSVVISGPVSLTGSIQVSGITNTINTEVVGDVSLTGSVSVVISSGAVTVSGVVSLTGSMTVLAVGAAAHDAAVAGAPILTGLEARTTNPTAVGDGDAVRAMADDMGRQIVMPVAPRDLIVDNHNGSLTVSTTLTLLAAGGAGVFRDLTALTFSNPTSVDSLITIFDGLVTGTERFRWEIAANGGGLVMVFSVPFKQATANNGWGITSSEVGISFTAQAVDTV